MVKVGTKHLALPIRILLTITAYSALSINTFNHYSIFSFIHQSTRRLLQAGTMERYLSCYSNKKVKNRSANAQITVPVRLYAAMEINQCDSIKADVMTAFLFQSLLACPLVSLPRGSHGSVAIPRFVSPAHAPFPKNKTFKCGTEYLVPTYFLVSSR
jgi:hypothetical protein